MRCAMAQPCMGSRAMLFRMSRSKVPWTKSVGLLTGHSYQLLRGECSAGPVNKQGERLERAQGLAVLFVEQFGVVFCKHGTKGGRGPLLHGVDFLNQTINVSGHHQQIADGLRAGIPVCMRRSARHEHRRSCAGLDFLFANPNVQSTLQHVPRFIVAPMKMWRGNEPRRTGWTAWVTPLGDHKGIAA